jgi:hypothetical protein
MRLSDRVKAAAERLVKAVTETKPPRNDMALAIIEVQSDGRWRRGIDIWKANPEMIGRLSVYNNLRVMVEARVMEMRPETLQDRKPGDSGLLLTRVYRITDKGRTHYSSFTTEQPHTIPQAVGALRPAGFPQTRPLHNRAG